ncbi:autotransporter adhesin AIDA-I, partial [Escherichia coli]|nr:autotransporter adhesin AIDA-I [Escherichia coli]
MASELARGHGFVLAKNTLLVLTVASAVGNAFAQTQTCAKDCNSNGGTVSSSDIQYVLSTGETHNIVVSGKGKQVVHSGGKTYSTVVHDKDGSQVVGDKGVAINTTVNAGAFQRVSAGASATGTTLSGGNQNIYTGGTASGTLVSSGG